jgi:hypothetical protein
MCIIPRRIYRVTLFAIIHTHIIHSLQEDTTDSENAKMEEEGENSKEEILLQKVFITYHQRTISVIVRI